MKKLIYILIIGSLTLASCKKTEQPIPINSNPFSNASKLSDLLKLQSKLTEDVDGEFGINITNVGVNNQSQKGVSYNAFGEIKGGVIGYEAFFGSTRLNQGDREGNTSFGIPGLDHDSYNEPIRSQFYANSSKFLLSNKSGKVLDLDLKPTEPIYLLNKDYVVSSSFQLLWNAKASPSGVLLTVHVLENGGWRRIDGAKSYVEYLEDNGKYDLSALFNSLQSEGYTDIEVTLYRGDLRIEEGADGKKYRIAAYSSNTAYLTIKSQ